MFSVFTAKSEAFFDKATNDQNTRLNSLLVTSDPAASIFDVDGRIANVLQVAKLMSVVII